MVFHFEIINGFISMKLFEAISVHYNNAFAFNRASARTLTSRDVPYMINGNFSFDHNKNQSSNSFVRIHYRQSSINNYKRISL